MLEQVQALPGVTSAAVANELPLLGGDKRLFEAVGQTPSADATLQAEYRAVSPPTSRPSASRSARGERSTRGTAKGRSLS